MKGELAPRVYNRGYFESPESPGDFTEDVKELPLLVEWLGLKPGKKVLDVGCGLGRFESVIAEQGAQVTGIDISEYAIEQARRRHENSQQIQFICGNALETDFESCFDSVFCYHFVEHISLTDGRILLRKIHRLLKSNGILVMGLPIDDVCFPRRLVHSAATRRRWNELGHITSYSKQDIKREITSAGYEVTNMLPLSYFGIRLPEQLPQIPLMGLPIICADIRAIKQV
jgi:ubiquinone/menaquinone biosynthesis C-methylase UbiE